ncbi:MAG: histidinol-phosphate aminotransferase family protein [Eubacterium sp.]|nr:histidinol-phosphate aminotransferase family protein [Eubacterium sp.]
MAHGGDRYRNRVEYDFSINVNPLGMPEVLRKALMCGIENAGFYPDPRQEAVRQAAALFYGERARTELSPEWVIPGNGASELITAVMQVLRPKNVLLPVPCFTGYSHAAYGITFTDKAEKIMIREYQTQEKRGFQPFSDFLAEFMDHTSKETDLLILANPCNPGGMMMDYQVLRAILKAAAWRHIPVLLDECFFEFTVRKEESGLRLQEEYSNLLVLRAFTKIFAMPGVRLGCLFCRDEELGERIRRALPEWNLSSFAEAVMISAGKQRRRLYGFLDKTVRETASLRESMLRRIEGISADRNRKITTFPSVSNFLLTTGWGMPGKTLAGELLKRGILVRCCGDMSPLNDDYIRLAVRPEEEQDKLFEALYACLKQEIK